MRIVRTAGVRRAVALSAVAVMSLLSPSVASTSSAASAEVRTFKHAGDHTFTVPERVSRIHVVALGAGGGAGGGHNDGSLRRLGPDRCGNRPPGRPCHNAAAGAVRSA